MTKIIKPEYFQTGFCSSDATTPAATIGASFFALPVQCSLPPLPSPPPSIAPSSPAPPSALFPYFSFFAPSVAAPSFYSLYPSSSPSAPPPTDHNVVLELWDTCGLRPSGRGGGLVKIYLRYIFRPKKYNI
jgi:hypothetical protein